MAEPSTGKKFLFFVLVFAGVFGALHWHGGLESLLRPAPEPIDPLVIETSVPSYGPLQEFSLVEASGEYLTLKKMKGKVWVASFIFTTCAGTCPAMANRCQVLQNMIPDGVQLMSISVDPDRDSPEVLMEWGKKYERNPEKWLLATGDFLGIRKLMIEGFHLEGDDPLNHSNGFALVDQQGMLRGHYDSLKEEEMAKLVKDLNLVLHEYDSLGR